MVRIKTHKIAGVFIVAGLLFLAGCGSSSTNSSAVYNLDLGSHPQGWTATGHAAAAQADISACQECHGNDLAGGITGISCMSCHVNGSPLADSGCTSCHDAPPSGTSAPNINGAHAAHAAVPGIAGICDTCHAGAGSGTVNHDNGVVDVQILNAYSAKSGTAEHNPDGTCSNVSCHGGQTTPLWSGGAIDANTQCTECHSYGTSQYNSFSSGQHDFHVNQMGLVCIACHDVQKLAQNHFAFLSTPAMEGPAAATVGSLVTDYTNGTCTTRCHDSRSW